MSPLRLWAGVECTVNRVGSRYISQCEKSGHSTRESDLELFAQLGAARLRYPCLWESVSPERPEHRDWSWLDRRLTKIRELGMMPIAGLLHHGSGPKYTSLVDKDFPELFAAYARAFAERYPWVEDYTPINEPLTTARFSCLYGVWYPHMRDDMAFSRAVYNQARATALAMREIRKINPSARLIQTEDLGRAQSTEPVAEQRDFENERRWLTYDLLCGRVGTDHALYNFLLSSGVTHREFLWLQENPCPPDVLGVNHYPLSSRFLDHRLERYPESMHGGNGRIKYVDVGAIDVPGLEKPTPESLLMEAWERYRLPIAVTEVHVRGYREQQLAWFRDIWSAATAARSRGADVCAVTAWSLLGSFDWNTLCTDCGGFYEPGVFDLRGGKPEPTALATAIQRHARNENPHPLFDRPILITGAKGTLGRAFARVCESRGLQFQTVNRAQMDIADPTSVEWAIDVIRPWAVINAAGYVNVDLAESESERCFRENSSGAQALAKACQMRGLPLLTFSSDLVFNGEHSDAYRESHPVSPLNVYGRSKAEGERRVLESHPRSLVVRTSSFFGPWDEYNFLTRALRELHRSRPIFAASDIQMSPTYVPDLAHTCLDLLIDGAHGIVHLANDGRVTWSEFALMAARRLGLDERLIVAKGMLELGWPARRPRQSSLASERVRPMPALENAIDRYLAQLEIQLKEPQRLEEHAQ